VILALTLD